MRAKVVHFKLVYFTSNLTDKSRIPIVGKILNIGPDNQSDQ